MVFGAIVGGLSSAATDGDIGMGMLTGAIGGAFFLGAGELVGAGMPSFLAHTGAGMMSGGVNSAINGGDIGMGMLTGAISGGLGEFAGGLLSEYGLNNFGEQFVGRSLMGGLTGGITSEIYGGSFGDGFVSGMKTTAIGYLGNHMTHQGWKRWKGYHTQKRWEQGAKRNKEKAWELVKPGSQEEVAARAKGTVHRNGLRQVPSIFPAAGAVTLFGVGGSLYEPLMIAAGTPQGQILLRDGYNFASGLISGGGYNPTRWGQIGHGVNILLTEPYGLGIMP